MPHPHRIARAVAWNAARAHAWATGSRLFACYRELQANQRLSADELRAHSNRNLRKTIAHAHEHVPYYRRLFRERGLEPRAIRTVDDLPLLPVLTKQIIRSHFDELHPVPLPKGVRHSSTGGSTGEAIEFLSTQEMHDWHNAGKLRAWEWAGYTLGTPLGLLWGSPLDVQRFKSIAGRLRQFVNREHLQSAHILSPSACDAFLDRLRRANVRGLHAYAGAAYTLAKHCLDNGVDDIRLGFALTSAETLFDFRRAAIETAFHCPVFDHYGSRETSLVSHECPQHGGYHVSIDNGIIEIDCNGRPANPGEMGRVLVTDFRNRAMPFIRYEIGDVAVAAEKPCPCGLPFPTFQSVEGRISDMMVLRDGGMVSPLFVVGLLFPDPETNWGGFSEELAHVDQYQVIQEDYDDFTVRLVLNDGFSIDRYRYIEGNLRRTLSPGIRVTLERVDDIPATGSGKRRPFISRVAPN